MKNSFRLSLMTLFFVLFIAFWLFIPTFFYGSSNIFEFISTISPIEHRSLEINKNDNSYVTIKKDTTDENFKILQLTDLHLTCSYFGSNEDIASIKSLIKVVTKAQPDLIIITGDMLFPLDIRSYNNNNKLIAKAFVQIFENIGIPYAFTYGNHDAEPYSFWNQKQLNKFFTKPEFTNCLFRPQLDTDGDSCYAIKLLNNDNSLNTVLYLMDNSTSYFSKAQIDWYEHSISTLKQEIGETPKSLMFFHIPLYEYQLAYNMVEKQQLTFAYGECCENVSYLHSDLGLFDKIVELNSTKAVFCGHDHRNTWGAIYNNVLLSYCPSLDYKAYLTVFEGERLMGGQNIIIDSNNNVSIQQIYVLNI